MPNTPSMRSLLEDVLLPTDDTADEAEVADTEAADTADAPVVEGTEDKADEAEGTPAPEGDDETPVEYYGVDLSALSADERASIIAGFQERDKFIQQLLRNKAEDAPADEAKDATPDSEAVTDADILKALGLDDPDDAYAEHTAKAAVPLAKLVLSLQSEVTDLKQRTELDATERYWETSLTALEAQFGKLPASHPEVMKQAAEAGVAEPVDAFWRIMGPARQQVMTEVQKRREAVAKSLKDGAKGNVRPKDEAEGSEKVISSGDVRDATKQALTSLFRERGIALNDSE